MTDLTSFLGSLYASVTEAELQSRRHGEARFAELLAAGELSEDDALPVYHASDVAVTLDVCLTAEETEAGPEMHVTDDCDDDTSLSLTIDLLDLVDRTDLPAGDDGSVPPVDQPDDDVDGPPADDPVEDGDVPGEDGDETPDEPDDDADPDSDEKPDDDPDETRGTGDDGKYPVELVDGIGPKRAHRLREAGVQWVEQLAELSAAEIAESVSQDGETVSVEEARQWLIRATHLLARDRHASETLRRAKRTEDRDRTERDERERRDGGGRRRTKQDER